MTKLAMILPRCRVLRELLMAPDSMRLQGAVGQHLGVQAQVVLVCQGFQDGVGDGADADLEGGAVLDEGADPAADGARHVVRRRVGDLRQRRVVLHHGIDGIGGDEAVAQGPRHAGIDLGDDQARALDRWLHNVNGDTEATEAVLVGWRHLDEGHVDGDASAAEQAGHLREEDGRVVRLARGDALPHVGPDEERVVAKGLFHPGQSIGRDAQRHDVDDLGGMQLFGAGRETLHQELGRCGAGAHEDVLAAADDAQGLVGGTKLVGVAFAPVWVVGRLGHAGIPLNGSLRL